MSYDVLHFDDTGMGGAHLWPIMKDSLHVLGRTAETKVEIQ
jgi:hypothetical protein